MTDNIVRWGMLSTSSIGRVMAQAFSESNNAKLVAIAGRDAERSRAYASELEIPRSYGSYDDLLEDPDIDAIYIPLPISFHADWTIKALKAGKNVLCEKPLASSVEEVSKVFDAADEAGCKAAEGLMWRHHPRTYHIQNLLEAGTIGDLLHIRTALSVSAPAGDIRRTGALGGGAYLDLGCYCVSAIRLFGGEPTSVSAFSITDTAEGADGIDLRTSSTMLLEGDRMAQFDVALDFPRRDELELIGSKGRLSIPDPWLCRVSHFDFIDDSGVTRLSADEQKKTSTTGNAENVDAYRIEIEQISAEFLGKTESHFGRSDALGQATVLEAIRESAKSHKPVNPKQFVPTF